MTICTFQKRCIFGTIADGEMRLNRLGFIVREEWLRTAILRPEVKLGDFAVMPNHMHGIIVIQGAVPLHGTQAIRHGTGDRPVAATGPKNGSLGAILGNFKGAVTKRARRLLNIPQYAVWQRDFYDHIIRDGEDWDRIRAYILDNAKNWSSDPENPSSK